LTVDEHLSCEADAGDVQSNANPANQPCPCGADRLIRVLAAHPLLRTMFARFCRSQAANWIVTAAARAIIARHRGRAFDYERLLEAHACEAPEGPEGSANIDCDFSAALLGNPEGRRRLARFLQSLEGLDTRVRAGLLRTWLHACVLGAMLREARFASDRRSGVCRHYPIDAIVAPFGRCNLRCRGCYALGELGRPSANLTQLDYVIKQVKRLNVYHVLLVGSGEPFYDQQSRRLLIGIARRHPQVFFSVYSNGTNIADRDLLRLRRVPNLIPVLSLDGPEVAAAPDLGNRQAAEVVEHDVRRLAEVAVGQSMPHLVNEDRYEHDANPHEQHLQEQPLVTERE
jgi:hypothetical protein